METYNDWLAHHGILGMEWGKRNGPPYPLNSSQMSSAERRQYSDRIKLNKMKEREKVRQQKAKEKEQTRQNKAQEKEERRQYDAGFKEDRRREKKLEKEARRETKAQEKEDARQNRVDEREEVKQNRFNRKEARKDYKFEQKEEQKYVERQNLSGSIERDRQLVRGKKYASKLVKAIGATALVTYTSYRVLDKAAGGAISDFIKRAGKKGG